MQTAIIRSSRPRTWRRWFAFLGGGIAWTMHLLSIYVAGEFGCVSGWGRISYLGISAVAWTIIIASIFLLIVSAAATVTGYLDARADAKRSSPSPEDEGGEYLSRLGWLFSTLFTLIIFVETLPVFAYLHGC
ncbi:MAG: hypothetical protein AAGU11_12240 [Syntrophobacteraceae bacterium]